MFQVYIKITSYFGYLSVRSFIFITNAMLTLGILAIRRLDLKVSYEQKRAFCCHIFTLNSSPCLWSIRKFHKTQTHSAQGSLRQQLLENQRLEGVSMRAHAHVCWRSMDKEQHTQRQWKHLLSTSVLFQEVQQKELLRYLNTSFYQLFPILVK